MKFGDNMIFDKTPETIKGWDNLVLEAGKRYEIHYGIHQGIYIYEGKIADNETNRKNHPYSINEHMFRDCETGELSFGYYPHISPYEFTSIVKRCNKQ